MITPGYERLQHVFDAALEQAAGGKGKERHVDGTEPFHEQDICTEAKKLGLAAPAFQARKKIKESLRLLEIKGPNAAAAELLGAINYAAAMVIVINEQAAGGKDSK